jgi:hypothetical protein
MNWNVQPAKGVVLILISLLFSGLLWVLLIGVFGLTYENATIVFAVCFANFWHLGVSWGGWPTSLVTEHRLLRGLINWTLAMLFVGFTIFVWSSAYSRPFYETPIAKWAQTCIFIAVMQIFLFRNRLITPWDVAEILEARSNSRQPLNGVANFLFAIVFVPTAMYFVPPMWGLPALYIPWYWFPLSVVVVDFCDWWPFEQLGQPYAGIMNTGIVVTAMIAMMAAFRALGSDFFDDGVAGKRAAIFAAIWTNQALIQGWTLNMWPYGHWPKWKKALSALVVSLMVSIACYGVVLELVPSERFDQLMFWMFAWMWALVCLAAPGFFHLFLWGYEENPHGAGVGRAGHNSKAVQVAAST